MAERFGAVYRIVSYRDILCSIVSYRIHRFPPRLYRAITKTNVQAHFHSYMDE